MMMFFSPTFCLGLFLSVLICFSSSSLTPINRETVSDFLADLFTADPRTHLAEKYSLAHVSLAVVFRNDSASSINETVFETVRASWSHSGTLAPETIFSIGSVSKTFISLLLGRQLLSLPGLPQYSAFGVNSDAKDVVPDVGIKSEIWGSFNGGQPRTPTTSVLSLKRLMSHSAGIDETFLFGASGSPSRQGYLGLTLEEDIRTNLPPRIREVDQVVMYSNYGSALAALIAERLNGSSYSDFLLREFDRLGLNETKYGWELVMNDQNLCPIEYSKVTERGTIKEVEFLAYPHATLIQNINARPAGAVYSTIGDMETYTKWLLDLSQSQTDSDLEEFLFGNANRFGLGTLSPSIGSFWYETPVGDLKWDTHDGDLGAYHAMISLQKEKGIGLIVLMSGGSAGIRGDFREGFTNAFVGDCSAMYEGGYVNAAGHCVANYTLLTKWPTPNDATRQEYATKMTGCYLYTRYPHTSWMRILVLQQLLYSASFCLYVSDAGFLQYGSAGSALFLPREVLNSSATPLVDFVLAVPIGNGLVQIDWSNGPDLAFRSYSDGAKYWQIGIAPSSYEFLGSLFVLVLFALSYYVFTVVAVEVFAIPVCCCIAATCPFCIRACYTKLKERRLRGRVHDIRDAELDDAHEGFLDMPAQQESASSSSSSSSSSKSSKESDDSAAADSADVVVRVDVDVTPIDTGVEGGPLLAKPGLKEWTTAYLAVMYAAFVFIALAGLMNTLHYYFVFVIAWISFDANLVQPLGFLSFSVSLPVISMVCCVVSVVLMLGFLFVSIRIRLQKKDNWAFKDFSKFHQKLWTCQLIAVPLVTILGIIGNVAYVILSASYNSLAYHSS